MDSLYFMVPGWRSLLESKKNFITYSLVDCKLHQTTQSDRSTMSTHIPAPAPHRVYYLEEVLFL